IPLLGRALHILDKYRTHPEHNKGLLLPVYANHKVNAYLKEITAILGIPKNITLHSARHTFATTITLSNGVPIETASKLQGHTKVSTTQVYARVLERKISEDMQKLKIQFSNKDNPVEGEGPPFQRTMPP